MGCGIGGPARNIAHHSGAEITGLNCNEYQIKKATKLTAEAKLQHLVKYDKVTQSYRIAYMCKKYIRVILMKLHMVTTVLMQSMPSRLHCIPIVERKYTGRHSEF